MSDSLNKKMVDALNAQIQMEGHASFYYLAMASWCQRQGLEGCAQFFFRQQAEEHDHMMRIITYMLDVDATVISPGIQAPPTEWSSIHQVFQDTLAHEQKVTQAIHTLVNLSHELGDHASYSFLQWYVDEQREEEALMRNILDKLRLIGDGPQSLYFIDKEIEAINSQAAKAE